MKKHLKLIKTLFAVISTLYTCVVFLSIFLVQGGPDMLFVYSGIAASLVSMGLIAKI